MKTLVTGGAGFIGSILVDRLLAEGHAVDVVDDLSTGSMANLTDARSGGQEFSFQRLDIRSPDLADFVGHRRPDVVFHLAGPADVRASLSRPAEDADLSIVGSLNVLEAAWSARVAKVVFASSGAVFGDVPPESLPVKESQIREPRSPHGVAKQAVHAYLRAYRDLHDLEFTALALANVYGPRQVGGAGGGVVSRFAERVVAGEACVISGDGTQTRDFVFVDDVVDAFARALERGGGLLLNIGTGVETPISRVHEAVNAAAGIERAAQFVPAPPGDTARSALDPTRARIHLGWKPWTSLEGGVAEVLRWMSDQRAER